MQTIQTAIADIKHSGIGSTTAAAGQKTIGAIETRGQKTGRQKNTNDRQGKGFRNRAALKAFAAKSTGILDRSPPATLMLEAKETSDRAFWSEALTSLAKKKFTAKPQDADQFAGLVSRMETDVREKLANGLLVGEEPSFDDFCEQLATLKEETDPGG